MISPAVFNLPEERAAAFIADQLTNTLSASNHFYATNQHHLTALTVAELGTEPSRLETLFRGNMPCVHGSLEWLQRRLETTLLAGSHCLVVEDFYASPSSPDHIGLPRYTTSDDEVYYILGSRHVKDGGVLKALTRTGSATSFCALLSEGLPPTTAVDKDHVDPALFNSVTNSSSELLIGAFDGEGFLCATKDSLRWNIGGMVRR